jgi:ribonuclease BN (tRNA processing enzyme)
MSPAGVDGGLRVLCLGVGDAHSARWYSSSLALQAEGSWLLFDCAHPIRKALREAADAAGLTLDVGDFAAVLLSHLHADHASGLEGWGFYSFFALGRPAVVLAHPEVIAPIWDRHLAATMGTLLPVPGSGAEPVVMSPEQYFAFRPLDETRPVDLGPFSIECRRAAHPIPTFAMRIRAAGRCLGLSADTSYDPGLIDWLAPADLIVHETNVGIHTPYAALAALPADLRARMRLIHYPDDFDLDASLIEPMRPGRMYDV